MPEYDIINRQALSHISALLSRWLPGGKYQGREYVALNPKRHDRNPGSFSVNIETGTWADFASGDKGGDLVSLYAYLFGINQHRAAKELAKICTGDFLNVCFLPERASKVPKAPKVGLVNPSVYAFWRQSRPAKDSLAETYLRTRGIICKLPQSLRFLPKAYHKPTNLSFPCMVSGVERWGQSGICAIHRTYLSPDGKSKALIEPNKMMLGHMTGGAVRFGNDLCTLVVAEGIETALSVYQATGLTVWAALSTAGITNLVLPPPSLAPKIILAADHDQAGITVAQKAADRWLKLGYQVRLALPAVYGKDFNDLLREAAL